MIVGNGADGVEMLKVVLVRRVVSFPSHNIKRAEFRLGLVHMANVFVVDLN